MPYIEQEDREHLKNVLDTFLTGISWLHGAGYLNYIITRILVMWLGSNPNYAKYNEVIGVLECAKLEIYRRQISVYEDKKCSENGDVYNKEERNFPV